MTTHSQCAQFDSLFERMRGFSSACALRSDAGQWEYRELLAQMEHWRSTLAQVVTGRGEVVAFEGDYDAPTIGLLLALLREKHVAVPLAPGTKARVALMDAAGASTFVDLTNPQAPRFERHTPTPHGLLQALRSRGRAGLVVFSSGTTGQAKAALFDFGILGKRYRRATRPRRTLAFLFIDHLGGINTLLHTLASGGTLVASGTREPDDVARTIAHHRVQVLPTTPTFLRMLLLSGQHRRHDLSSLELISYGTEPMPPATLAHVRAEFPKVRLKQTYGLSELGVLPTRTPSSASLWLEIGGIGCETKVVDGVLHIRSETAMVGYLNAPAPFDPDGWYNTHDLVETKGKFIRFLGRDGDIINVGGEKVHPAEVENVLLGLSNVEDALVWGHRSPITGQLVAARIKLAAPEDAVAAQTRIYRLCQALLPAYKVPAVFEFSDEPLIGSRLKKARGPEPTGGSLLA